MNEGPGGERTEEASQQRIEKARKEGDVPKSREFNSAITLLLGLLAMWVFGGVRQLAGALTSILRGPSAEHFFQVKLLFCVPWKLNEAL